MSFNNGGKQLFKKCGLNQAFISKFTNNSKFWSKNEFVGAGWTGSGGSLGCKHILSPQSFHQKFIRLNPEYVRGIRSGGGKGSFSTKNRTSILTALEDSGIRMAGIFDAIIKPAVFTSLVVTGSFIGSSIWQYENHKHKIRATGSFSGLTGEDDKLFEFRKSINQWWKKASIADRIFWPICGLNAVVFACWHTPGFTSRMVTYFTSTPASRAICWPMLLSVFSHYSILHLGANMFVLHSFLPAAITLMGPEQFVGTYLTAGVLSSFGSHIHKLIIGSVVPSLGASGAIMGILAYVCMKMPDIQLGIIFLPGISFSADTAIKCILAVDTVGLFAGWKVMDHAAHLSGALYGIAICYGEDYIAPIRNKIMQYWHRFRTGES